MKGTTVEDNVRALYLCYKAGINSHVYIIIGSPEETEKDLDDTVHFLRTTKPLSVGVSRLTPVIGSALYEFAVKSGLLKTDNWEDHDYYTNKYPMRLKYLSEMDLDRYTHVINGIVGPMDIIWRIITNPRYLSRVVVDMLRDPKRTAQNIKHMLYNYFHLEPGAKT